MMHCFDYLRQALMCAGDMTLESLQVGEQGVMASVDGWGSTHRCRKFDDVREWTARYRASGSAGIL